MKKLSLSILAILFYLAASAQCSVVEVPLSQRANASNLIVEGKVISQNSFWNTNSSMIYTSSVIEVYKIFKGELSSTSIEILTEGGTVGDKRISAEPSLNLNIDDIGIFTCIPVTRAKNIPVSKSGIPRFETYASLQGFVKYDLANGKASDVFKTYNNIESDIYPVMLSTGFKNYKIVKAFDVNGNANRNSNPNPETLPVISSFSPTTITAGTGSVLTINGSNFGSSPGTVGFKNADDGGATYINPLSTEIVTWSNTQITVKVPSQAGTGTILVTQAGTDTSAGTLTISWAHLNVHSGNIAYQTRHVNNNGSGGYTWKMNANVDGNPTERAAFMRAFDTWRCTTGINWVIGTTTAVNDAASDGTNCICNDNANPLAAGILGECFSYWSGCNPGSGLIWFVNELDIVFDEGSNLVPLSCTWNYGPGAPTGTQYDFESVCVHELGHGHQLAHVINPGQIMHYALSNGASERVLSANDIAGGNFVQAKSVAGSACGFGAMTNHSCGTPPVADFSGTPTTLCAGHTIAYTDLSTNTPTSWSWIFQGGSPPTSTSQNPTVTYNTAGSYSVSLTATNAAGSDVQSYAGYITVNANPTATGIVTNVFCNGNNDGAINLTPAGGSGTYSYLWNPSGQTTQDRTNLSPATYSVTVTDANGCTSLTSYIITQPIILSATSSQINVSCNSGSNGTATVTPSGGTPSYIYAWAPSGGSAATASTLSAGNYTCTITDANACFITKTFNITAPLNPITASTSHTNVSCNGSSDGSASVFSVAGGTAGYSYSWSPSGGTGATASPLAPGGYTCTITDANGCTLTQTDLITEPGAIIVSMSKTNENCLGGDGTATATASGGNAPYTYLWALGGQTTLTATNLSSATYTCTVTDNSGCSNNGVIAVGNTCAGSAPVANFSGTPTTLCQGGSVAFTDLSLNSPTSWVWIFQGGNPSSSSSQNPTIIYNTAGTYSVSLTATNASGSDVQSFVGYITVNPNPNAVGVVTNISCNGSGNGIIDLTPSGGTGPYTFLWSPSGQSTEDRNNLTPSTYSVTVTDANGCTSLTSYAITQPSAIGVTMSGTNASCSNNDGSATVIPSGGAGGYTYLWSPSGQTTSTATALSAGTYNCVVTDASGCSNSGTVSIISISCGPTRLTPASCGITLSSLSQQIYCVAVAGATNYRYRWINAAQGFNSVFLRNGSQTNFYVTWATGIQYGRTYTVEVATLVGGVWSAYGAVCTVTTPASIPLTQLTPTYCGFTETDLIQLIYCTAVPGATNYQWRVSDPSIGFSSTKIRNTNTADFRLVWISGIQYGRIYNVEMCAYVGGVWGNYGGICTVSTPASIPLTQVISTYCGATLAAISTQIFCNTVSGATNYEWKVENSLLGYSKNRLRGNDLTNFYLSWCTGIQVNTTYTVTIRAYAGGVWGTFGPPCSITTGPTALAPNSNDGIVPSEVRLANPDFNYDNQELTMDIYPNPFAENITVTTDPIVTKLSIYNSFGELVRIEKIQNGTAELNLGDLPAGIYLIEAQTETGIVTKRIIKQ